MEAIALYLSVLARSRLKVLARKEDRMMLGLAALPHGGTKAPSSSLTAPEFLWILRDLGHDGAAVWANQVWRSCASPRTAQYIRTCAPPETLPFTFVPPPWPQAEVAGDGISSRPWPCSPRGSSSSWCPATAPRTLRSTAIGWPSRTRCPCLGGEHLLVPELKL